MTAQPFQIIPVLDLKGGQAVHARGGRREHYQPVRTSLHAGSDVIGLAQAIRSSLGLSTLYVADLDAIAGSPPALEIYRSLLALGFWLWLDCGLTDAHSASAILERDRETTTIIAALETMSGPRALAKIVALAGPERVIFSLDLHRGRPILPARNDWGSAEPLALAGEAVALGARRLVLLDLARVGTGRGPGTMALLSQIGETYPGVATFVGGGIAGIDTVLELKARRAAGVLLGSALHDGTIGRRELRRLAVATTAD